MTRNTGEIDQAVSRTLRDSLERLQRTTEELNQAVADMVSACGSARPGNSLPPMLRAQMAAASLSASLDVLSRFVAMSLQMDVRPGAAPESALPVAPVAVAEAPVVIAERALESQPAEALEELQASEMEEEGAPVAAEELPPLPSVMEEAFDATPIADPLPDPEPVAAADELSPQTEAFQIASLPAGEQELHRRANRVAKVSMQDIKMLRPHDVLLGKENRDICMRLRDDIEKAHREYDRRFQTILGHPVDYFHDWMVEILGDGDPGALGEYPYPSPVLRR